jgi:hypothetical protein
MRELVTSAVEIVSLAAIVAGVTLLFGVAWALIAGGLLGLGASALVAR